MESKMKLNLQFFADNQIELFKAYIPILDEVYQEASKTAVLDGNPELAQAGSNANELVIPKISMEGLGDYSRSSGYVSGDVTLTNETVPVNFDRGRMFVVDSMDNAETAGIAFGRLAGEFIRTKVVPELDAFRFAVYASKADTPGTKAETFANGEAVIKALRAASNQMDEAEVPMEDRHLFITPTVHGMISDLDTTKSKEVMARFASLTLVPQSRFYTAIEQKSGEGAEKAGGFTKAATGKDINFMILHKAAVIQFPKHIAPKVVTPEQNPDADAWKFGYRQVGVTDVYENKVAGIYLNHKA